MTIEPEKESMDIDSPEESKESPCELVRKGLSLYRVSVNDSGEGLPYAPQDWPIPGDKWRWKVGKRIAVSGNFIDRYLYLPRRLCETGHTKVFASRLSVEQYIREKFPGADVEAFYASFSWRIPSKRIKRADTQMSVPLSYRAGDPGSDAQIGIVCCKAGNRFCSSLAAQEDSDSEVMFCDMCCSETGFCRDCCCILCSRTIDKASEGCGFIRCEANIGFCICGHSCHINCALRAYMAGTVGGSIGLDAEYYCRRCDSKTDLVPHVARFLHECESNGSQNDIEKILNVGICVLRGSKRSSAKQLLHHIQLVMSKLKSGSYMEDTQKKEDASVETAGASPTANGRLESPENDLECKLGSPSVLSSNFDYRVESLTLDYEIDRILDTLRKSQETEYRLAEERLSAQENYIINLYEQLERERSDFSKHASVSKNHEVHDSLLDAVQSRVSQIKREVLRLKDMGEVSKGFGRVPRRILEEQFNLCTDH